MPFLVSDQSSHFKNKVMHYLAEEHKIKYRFTVAYSPWVNGTVENLMRHIQSAYRALLSELKLAPQDWPLVVGMIMTALNEAPLSRLGKSDDGIHRSPLEVFTGLKPVRSQMIYGNSHVSSTRQVILERARGLQLIAIDEIQQSLDDMHKDVAAVSKHRAKQIAHHNKKTNIITPNFNEGDCVLVRRAQNKGRKLSFRLMGPRRITAIVGEMVYDVTGFVDHKTERVHAARLMLYKASVDGSIVSQDYWNRWNIWRLSTKLLTHCSTLVRHRMDFSSKCSGLVCLTSPIGPFGLYRNYTQMYQINFKSS